MFKSLTCLFFCALFFIGATGHARSIHHSPDDSSPLPENYGWQYVPSFTAPVKNNKHEEDWRERRLYIGPNVLIDGHLHMFYKILKRGEGYGEFERELIYVRVTNPGNAVENPAEQEEGTQEASPLQDGFSSMPCLEIPGGYIPSQNFNEEDPLSQEPSIPHCFLASLSNKEVRFQLRLKEEIGTTKELDLTESPFINSLVLSPSDKAQITYSLLNSDTEEAQPIDDSFWKSGEHEHYGPVDTPPIPLPFDFHRGAF